jgi:hypothetical protein
MSNSKISALTSATTPLAGTEVLPIVQSSTTKQVSVANLTAGRIQTSNGILQGTAATGYNFTANTPASGMTSQLLNWYEQGTWTPTVTANIGTITTVGTVVGSYTRIGRQVTAMFDCTITTNGTGSSYIKVAGIPFASVTYVASGAGKEYNVTDKSLNLVLAAGSTTIGVFFYDGTYPGGNNYRLLGTLTYFV